LPAMKSRNIRVIRMSSGISTPCRSKNLGGTRGVGCYGNGSPLRPSHVGFVQHRTLLTSISSGCPRPSSSGWPLRSHSHRAGTGGRDRAGCISSSPYRESCRRFLVSCGHGFWRVGDRTSATRQQRSSYPILGGKSSSCRKTGSERSCLRCHVM
jgi:hypothetical protein